MLKIPFRRLVFLAAWLVLLEASAAAGPVRPASIFSDHMVLQRNKPAPVWGTAAPGEAVTVIFAGQSKSVTAGKDGKWLVRLDPLEASGESRDLAIQGASGSVLLRDVLVGDVWIAGGQSNMGRNVRASWRPDGFEMNYPGRHTWNVSAGSRPGWPGRAPCSSAMM